MNYLIGFPNYGIDKFIHVNLNIYFYYTSLNYIKPATDSKKFFEKLRDAY